MPVLNCTVIVRDDNFVTHVFLAGVTPPDWATAKITNPDVWDGEKPPALAEIDQAPNSPAPVKIPPKSGPGSSAKAWRAYAATQGFAVEPDASATEIREALHEQGVATE